jgi:hypothetical protein
MVYDWELTKNGESLMHPKKNVDRRWLMTRGRKNQKKNWFSKKKSQIVDDQ